MLSAIAALAGANKYWQAAAGIADYAQQRKDQKRTQAYNARITEGGHYPALVKNLQKAGISPVGVLTNSASPIPQQPIQRQSMQYVAAKQIELEEKRTNAEIGLMQAQAKALLLEANNQPSQGNGVGVDSINTEEYGKQGLGDQSKPAGHPDNPLPSVITVQTPEGDTYEIANDVLSEGLEDKAGWYSIWQNVKDRLWKNQREGKPDIMEVHRAAKESRYFHQFLDKLLPFGSRISYNYKPQGKGGRGGK